mmetsp:Transcript_22887/g.11063  ORF Transcript_22887/g.11063 Transcript_22887/m.11063 type:complete len:103 (-) Transcript_22887:6626-6934(-)
MSINTYQFTPLEYTKLSYTYMTTKNADPETNNEDSYIKGLDDTTYGKEDVETEISFSSQSDPFTENDITLSPEPIDMVLWKWPYIPDEYPAFAFTHVYDPQI